MDTALAILVVANASALAYYHWIHHVIGKPPMSGDTWYTRRFAFTNDPISAPYCWRPLLPTLARWFGFKPVSYTGTFLAPLLLFFFVGGGWPGLAVGLMFIGTPTIYQFNVKNPEYAEGLGHALFIGCLMSLQAQHWSSLILFLAAALLRETLVAALLPIALFWYWPAAIPLVGGAVLARFWRAEDKDNQHPLVEKTSYETIKRWAGNKGAKVVHFACTVQPLRGLAFTVPFMWNGVGDFARLGCLGLAGIFILSIPASGQSRIVSYAFAIFAPFAAALPAEWIGFVLLLHWFWPIDLQVFDECGDEKFGYAR